MVAAAARRHKHTHTHTLHSSKEIGKQRTCTHILQCVCVCVYAHMIAPNSGTGDTAGETETEKPPPPPPARTSDCTGEFCWCGGFSACSVVCCPVLSTSHCSLTQAHWPSKTNWQEKTTGRLKQYKRVQLYRKHAALHQDCRCWCCWWPASCSIEFCSRLAELNSNWEQLLLLQLLRYGCCCCCRCDQAGECLFKPENSSDPASALQQLY